MPKIKELPVKVVQKTSAGEVVERPASVVKELIENSIDAGATIIKIEIEDSGLKKIAVSDNGEGMDTEDVLLSFLPHTTSKIFSEEDLAFVKSLGFRGEALASISAVSELTIKSRLVSEDFGTRIIVSFGKNEKNSTLGMDIGTQVVVKNLYKNVPARRKFLKSNRTETKHIFSIVIKYALSYLDIGFVLFKDGEEFFNLIPGQSAEERIKVLLGGEIYESLIRLNDEQEMIKLEGFILKPQISAETKSNQYLFVNKRSVSHNLVSNAIKEAYGSFLEPRSFPGFILNITIPFDMVDVNVHPRKEEVNFWNDKYIYDYVFNSVKNLLNSEDLTYKTDINRLSLDKKPSLFLFQHLKESVQYWDVRNVGNENEEIIQIANTFLITESNNGLLIVDQHAAHERIIYEQFLESFNNSESKRVQYVLDKPKYIDFSILELEALKEHYSTIEKLGFNLEEFGRNQYKVNTIPELFIGQSISEVIKEIISNLQENKKAVETKKVKKTLSYLACRCAIKAGEYLTIEQRKNLLDKLALTKTEYTCPHGRPVKVEVSLKSLNKIFKRIK
ncbi:hypothetical protein A3F07_01480 [candidate division WWE3 bacterium RIFCSPHIGHO2_12_FULL_38_15]|uniref:DNA mismatch repair protein MutL n=1 Tax=candidate division WWE3 bacterium RIFCSPHIGHO2_02_FULL_38_14 TaxID=1802620 RepID=A0A1F4V902_UNCKA|nr:MAG: hypothetical protein A2793_01820 [candidate division WWE3 bacterium RIFCSPHIGHO2_01_FULL_38_45]OGC48376.1 MAG: hypothetical protein A3F07_01480 [candidate division WWE3 bacterium RIFCSPHIGHO2_12_FULL_38_15]OGC53647.1 MAG: hypothetical protein A3D91_04375 [candidate division WWE3 bacterium RIFCSPHIGHO2_02_FULL_38_14]OGC54310.1 MAG: hypothetical protein A3B64_02275 [candidate division WWE3 bacterium RIFCSPLOWO2_01_FULL_37_24]HLB51555.1 DNA mismatch repair endonuclease MutL [Patescibacteri